MASGSGTAKKTQAQEAKFATLESLTDLFDETKQIHHDKVGDILIRQISVREFIEMQEAAQGDKEGTVDEWEATRLLLSAAVVDPPIGDDEDLIGKLPVWVTQWLTTEIAKFSGTDADDFTGESPTE